jgi:hypothetical protein
MTYEEIKLLAELAIAIFSILSWMVMHPKFVIYI